jgi:hypothetical protein
MRVESLGISTDTEDISLLNSQLSLSPNPASDFSILEFDSKFSAKAKIKLIGANGQLVQESEKEIIEGSNYMRLDFPGIASGQYLISLEINNQLLTTRLSVASK